MKVDLREALPTDLPFLKEMLYEAVYWRPNPDKPSFEKAFESPGMWNAIIDWGGRKGDSGVIAEVNSVPAGAAWFRYYMKENAIRGYYDDGVPVLVIAVHENFRQQGIGEKMIGWLLELAVGKNIKKISLMVSNDNHAVKLYRKCGFVDYQDHGDSTLMVREI